MRRAAQIDGNQKQIAKALEKCGAQVERKIARIGQGVPDLLVYFANHWTVLEIKMPGEKLTEAEEKWHKKFTGVKIVHTIEEAFQAVRITIRKQLHD